jgi:hypothetical protein
MHMTTPDFGRLLGKSPSIKDKAGAPDIEITPEMIEAGAAELLMCSSDFI